MALKDVEGAMLVTSQVAELQWCIHLSTAVSLAKHMAFTRVRDCLVPDVMKPFDHGSLNLSVRLRILMQYGTH